MKPIKRGNGSYVLQVSIEKKRQTISLGKIDYPAALIATAHVSKLVEARKHRTAAPPESMAWIQSLSTNLRKKLVDIGLISFSGAMTFKELFDLYLLTYNDGTRADGTIRRLKRSMRPSFEYFSNTPICEIGTANPSCNPTAYYLHLKNAFPSSASWSKSLSDTKQVFNWGVEFEHILSNPVRNLKGDSSSSESQKAYIESAVIEDILEYVRDDDLAMVIALSRWGGLRIPSELARLKWSDISWDRETMLVYAPKTGEERITPIFQPLLKKLVEHSERAEEGSEFIISKQWRADPQINLRRGFLRAIRRANYVPWNKIFNALRASIITDCLNRGVPIHIVTSWFGNSPKIALKHYALQTPRDWKSLIEPDLSGKQSADGSNSPRQNVQND